VAGSLGMATRFLKKFMIKVQFKKPQTFLANKEQGGCFTETEIVLNSIEVNKNYAYFNYNGFDLTVLLKSIWAIMPLEL